MIKCENIERIKSKYFEVDIYENINNDNEVFYTIEPFYSKGIKKYTDVLTKACELAVRNVNIDSNENIILDDEKYNCINYYLLACIIKDIEIDTYINIQYIDDNLLVLYKNKNMNDYQCFNKNTYNVLIDYLKSNYKITQLDENILKIGE